ncbi:MAG TPA: hypothetical protein VFE62_06975 [Gemmataceae bacterium]|nr:hypothetical protein [Gemmataceae bacterium]
MEDRDARFGWWRSGVVHPALSRTNRRNRVGICLATAIIWRLNGVKIFKVGDEPEKEMFVLGADDSGQLVGTQRLDITRDVPMGAIKEGEYPSDEPNPLDALIAAESAQTSMDVFLSKLPLAYRAIIKLMLQGRRAKEIADTLCISQQSVYRIIGLVTNRVKLDE